MNKILVDIKWQLLHRGYQLRLIILYFLVTDLILAVLPVSVCRYLDRNAMFLVMAVNLTYAFSILILFLWGTEYVDGKGDAARAESFRLAEPNPWRRLFARLFTNAVYSALCFGNALLGSSLMNKFADANHSYFKLEMNGNIPLGYLSFALAIPLLYHLLNLFSRRGDVRSFSLPALIVAYLLADVYWDVSSVHLPEWLVMPVTAVLMIAAFIKAGELEKNSH